MYLVDGNNVMGQRPGWHRDRQAARRRLMEETAALSHRRRIQIAVVFDGAPDPNFPEGSRYRGVLIHYARKGSDADERIVEMVESAANRRSLVVVTSDATLARRVRVCGVRVVRSGSFRHLLDEVAAGAQARGDEPEDWGAFLMDEPIEAWQRYFGVDEEDEDEE